MFSAEPVVPVVSFGCDVLVFGAYFADLIFRDLPRPVAAGTEVFARSFSLVPGGAFTSAMALHRLDRDVVWAADFGNDVFSREVLDAARAEGLDEIGFLHHPVPFRSVTAVLSYPHDRAMVSFQDCIRPQSLAMLLCQHRPRVLMLTQLRYGAVIEEALRVAHHVGTKVFMDCQDVPGSLSVPTVRDVFAEVDVFAPNKDEALRLTGTDTVDDALRALGSLVDTVVVKRGASGASAMHQGRRYDLDAIPVDALDTTGAGDCFNAGFVHAFLSGERFSQCLSVAMACGAAAVTALGSGGAPDVAELGRWLARVPARHGSAGVG